MVAQKMPNKASGNRTDERERLILGVTGASGAVYALELLEMLQSLPFEVHLVISKAGVLSVHEELGLRPSELSKLAHVTYKIGDVAAAISSGSFRTAGMIIAPCSVRTFSEIAVGTTSNLLTRAADVCLKERRKLILLVRETPLHAGHLNNLAHLSQLGAIIAPPVPAFYLKPKSLREMVRDTLTHILGHFAPVPGAREWPNKKGTA